MLFYMLIYISFVILLWLFSVWRKDASIVDRFWGILFVILSLLYYSSSNATHWRDLLLLTLVSIWGLRLSAHISLRNKGHGEDFRYKKMRDYHGKSFWWYSFFSVFLLQSILAIIISSPLYITFNQQTPNDYLWTDILGIVIWLVGFIFEAGSDWQLKKFKAHKKNKGKLLTSGFWSLTRHPNYFGDACVWWGYFCFSLSTDQIWMGMIGPLVMTYFLRYITGASLLEKDLKNTKPGYKEYIESTSAFIPWIKLK